MTEGFWENGFIIDLSNAEDTAKIASELTDILGISSARGKNICLKLGNIELSQAQLLSIKSLIESLDSYLAFIDTKSEKTIESAKETEILVSHLSNEIKPEPEIESETEIQVQEIEETNSENVEISHDSEQKQESYELLENTQEEKHEKLKLSETEAKTEIAKMPTLYLKQNLRSGQTMSYEGNVVLIGDTNPGSEIVAKGDITVWGVLGGIAHAGSEGNDFAKIRALKLNAIQIRISSYYARRPDMSNIPFISRSSQFVPEEAGIENNTIVIKKMNEN